MSCTNGIQPECNAFFESKEGASVVTVVYGYYINWGRPNHNVNRVRGVKDMLVEAGYSVQLKHDDVTMDYISLCHEDKEICRHDDIQHNRNFRNLPRFTDELVTKFIETVE